jgi:murein lipoprotein
MASRTLRLVTAAAALLGGLGLSGCATKGYVNEQSAGVSQRIDALEQRLQQTDAAAQGAAQAAQAAQGDARNANQRIDALTGRVDAIEQRLAARRPRN